ncbi:hypothetical protein ACHAPQ_000070 [Fusarium lateritium]
MKASMFLVGASAILASASPIRNALQERAMKTEWVYEVVTVVVTADQKKAEPTGVVFMEAPEYDAPKPTQEAEKPKPKKEEKPTSIQPTATKETEKVTVVTVVAESESKEEQVYKQPETVVEKPKSVVEEPKTTVKKVVATPTPTKAAEPKVTEASTPDLSLDGSYDTVMLAYHNIHRANHSVSALEWDDELAGYAENTANGCVFEHDMDQGKGGYGQNLASWGATSDIDDLKHKAAAGGITNQWYDSEMSNWAFYGQDNPPEDMNIDLYGHFTQVVWKDSTKVGCATVKCPAGTVLSFPSWYTVCNYNPQGNFGGRYGNNVLKPEGAKRVTV